MRYGTPYYCNIKSLALSDILGCRYILNKPLSKMSIQRKTPYLSLSAIFLHNKTLWILRCGRDSELRRLGLSQLYI